MPDNSSVFQYLSFIIVGQYSCCVCASIPVFEGFYMRGMNASQLFFVVRLRKLSEGSAKTLLRDKPSKMYSTFKQQCYKAVSHRTHCKDSTVG